MSTIRPANLMPASPVARPADSARLAAQKAFFDLALGKAATAAQAAPAATAQAVPTPAPPVQRIPDPQAAQPQRILRPGSLLDIKI